jgi:predicted N-acetyltransferase YhbS
MASKLNIHPANGEERAAAFRNFHDIWGGGLDVETHVRSRLENPKYKNAQWYVGCVSDRVVTACGCYRMQFRIDGKIEPACAFGEVHTLAEYRGAGFASRLLAFVEDDQRSQGKTLSVLYSDIDPAYYERLGYLLCDCPQGWADPRRFAELDSTSGRLERIDPAERWRDMARLYNRFHEPLPLWIARNDDYWSYLLARNPTDEFYQFKKPDYDEAMGYLRVARSAGELKIRDLALCEPNLKLSWDLLRSAFALAREAGVDRVGGWMHPSAPAAEAFEFSSRTRELTMVKPLVPRVEINASHQAAGAFLHEIDHV